MHIHVRSSAVILVLLSSVHVPAFGQLVTEIKNANELIDDYLLTCDELATAYCVRIGGTMSSVSARASLPLIDDMRGITAIPVNEEARYHAYGRISVVKPRVAGYKWYETLRFEDEVIDKLSLGERPSRPNLGSMVDRNGNRIRRDYPRIDPFGLVLCTEGCLSGYYSETAKLQQQFLRHVYKGSLVTELGDVVGTWQISPKRNSMVSVMFGKASGYLPVRTEYSKDGNCYSTITTEWQNYGTKWHAPKVIEQIDTRPGGDKVENRFEFEFIDPLEWQKNKIDFKALTKPVNMNWREPFMELFAKSAQRKKSRN